MPDNTNEAPATAPPITNEIRPPLLDLSLADAELHDVAFPALTNTLTPMVGLINHGCEGACAALAQAMRDQIATSGGLDGGVKQQACQMDEGEPCAAAAAELRTCLRGVCLRALRIALKDESLERTLAAASLDVQGRLCLRAYPAVAPCDAGADLVRLGAHCDSTLVTLLWSDGPGLQVLDPKRAAEWEPGAVMRYGLPTMGDVDAVSELRDDQWAMVNLPWASNPLLLTLGTSWLSAELTSSSCPARSAVLHRVTMATERTRYSLPFLADLVPAAMEVPKAGGA